MTSVNDAQRFSQGHPCPVCGGHDGLPQGRGVRCWGFLSDDGCYAHCTREQFAGNLRQEAAGTFAHRLEGMCRCGMPHGEAPRRDVGERRETGRHAYPIVNESGVLVATHHRIDFTNADGTREKKVWWEPRGVRTAELPLYRLRDLLAASPEPPVVLVEGEKACDALTAVGVLSVGTVTGAKSIPCDESLRPLAARTTVLVWPDNDADGRGHMERVAARLLALGATDVRWVDWRDAPQKGDAADYLDAHPGDQGGLRGLFEAARPYEPPSAEGDQGSRRRSPTVERSTSHRRIVLTAASTIEPRPVRWIWDTAPAGANPADHEGRFPEGALVLAVGRAGLGKSQFACWMAAAITNGTLRGSCYGRPRSVFYAASEDSWGMTIIPRLIAAGADLNRVFRIDVESDGDPNARLTLPLDTALLQESFREHDVALLVLDPMLSLLDGAINDYRAREVRAALEPLVAVADGARVTLLGIAHFTKATGSDPLLLISGSGAFGQLIRAGVGFARDEEGGLVLSTIKNNLGREDLPSLAYTIEPQAVNTPEGETWVSRLVLTGAPASRSVAEILRDRDDGDGHSEQREIDQWLVGYLTDSGGSAPAAEVLSAGRIAGWNDGAVKKARSRIKVESSRSGFGRGALYTWSLMDSMDSYTGARGSMESMVGFDL